MKLNRDCYFFLLSLLLLSRFVLFVYCVPLLMVVELLGCMWRDWLPLLQFHCFRIGHNEIFHNSYYPWPFECLIFKPADNPERTT
jgi:hypothetical protein